MLNHIRKNIFQYHRFQTINHNIALRTLCTAQPFNFVPKAQLEKVKALPKHGLIKEHKVTAVSHTLPEGLGPVNDTLREDQKVFAIVTVAGTQFKVYKGDRIIVNKVTGNAGDTYTFDHVLLIGTPEKSFIGRPSIKAAKVTALVEEQTKDEKITVLKRRRKKHSRRMWGHRRKVTFLRIQDIEYNLLQN